MVFIEELSQSPEPQTLEPPPHRTALPLSTECGGPRPSAYPLTPGPTPKSNTESNVRPREDTPCPSGPVRNASAGPSRLFRAASTAVPDPAPWLYDGRVPGKSEQSWKAIRLVGLLHAKEGGYLSVKDWLAQAGLNFPSEQLVGEVMAWYEELEQREGIRSETPAADHTQAGGARAAFKRAAEEDLDDDVKRVKLAEGQPIDLTGDSDDDGDGERRNHSGMNDGASEKKATGRVPWTGQQQYILLSMLIEAGKSATRSRELQNLSHRCTAQFGEMVDRWKRANPELMLLGPQRKDKRRIALVWPRMSSSKPGPGAWPQDKIEALWQAVLKEGMKQRGVFERIAAAVSKVGPWRAAANCKATWKETMAPHFGFPGRRR